MTRYFRISIFKNWLSTNTQGWVNSYEFETDSDTDVSDAGLTDATLALREAEQAIHLPAVVFNRAVIATYRQDGTPYNPNSFVTVPLSGTGQRAASSDALDLNAVYNVRRVVQYGRYGKLAYRGVLLENDVDATLSGTWQLEAGSPLQENGLEFGDYAGILQPLLTGDYGLHMALLSSSIVGGDPLFTRNVIQLVPNGVGFNRANHRYFDIP